MTTTDDPGDPPTPFSSKTLAELEAIEHGGRLMVPTAFKRRSPKGEIISVPIYLGETLLRDRGLAKLEAIAYVGGIAERKITTVPDAEAAIGADVFEQLDTAAIVSRCCFDFAPPHGRHQTLSGMVDTYGIRPIVAMYRELDAWTAMCATDVGDVTDERFWAMLEQIARVKHPGPLVVMPGGEQRSCLVRMAGLALTCRPPS